MKTKLFDKMKQIIFSNIFAILLILGVTSCAELDFIQTPIDSLPPASLEIVSIDSIPGGAKITYTLPDDETDMSYVKCEYVSNGIKKVVRASIYNNYLLVEGLGTADPVDVTLYVVDHSENLSTPITRTFTPGRPPIEVVFQSLEFFPDFGGVTIRWENDFGVEIGFTIFAEEYGEMREGITKFFDKGGEYRFDGYDDTERRYAIQIMDKWGNVYSTVKEGEFASFFQRKLDRENFKVVVLPGDNNTLNSNPRPLSNALDGTTNTIWHSDDGDLTLKLPHTITIDLGVVAQLSRLRLWPRVGDNHYYGGNTFRTFELWGTTELPAIDSKPEEYWKGEGWKNDWSMLGDYEIIRPSGLPVGTPLTPEDKAFATVGFEFVVDSNNEKARYLRFIIKTTWINGPGLQMAEFDFYGDDGTREGSEETKSINPFKE